MNESDKPAVILIVDDDSQVRELMSFWLTDEGYELVMMAEFGEQALSKAGQVKIDLALVDLQLTGSKVGGVDVVAFMHGRFPGMPIVVVSGHTGYEQTVLKAGADAFLGKPFTRKELLGVVKKVLGD